MSLQCSYHSLNGNDKSAMTPDMSESYTRPQVRMKLTKNIPVPNEYIVGLTEEFADYAFDEERAPSFKGKWRSEVFKKDDEHRVDLEIGTGNGFHFAHYAKSNPERSLVGFELKYKPLIQTIRRALRDGCENARVCRYNAHLICDIFEKNELNDVLIHFPDPYPKKKHRKNRLLTENFLNGLFELQKSGSKLYFKTDSEDYYDFALPNLESSKYEVVGETRDLHNSEFVEGNFVTAFEDIFLRKGQPIFYAEMLKS